MGVDVGTILHSGVEEGVGVGVLVGVGVGVLVGVGVGVLVGVGVGVDVGANGSGVGVGVGVGVGGMLLSPTYTCSHPIFLLSLLFLM